MDRIIDKRMGTWGDYDNDGYPDLFVSRLGANSVSELRPNTLYHNEGNGTFTSITTGLIVTEPMHTHAGIWGDFDNNGILDLAVANYGGAPPSIPIPPNLLYRGHGDGTFDRFSFGTKSPTNGDSWNVAAADFNNDGWLDLFVANLGPVDTGTVVSIRQENNFLYHNNGDGTFTKITTGRLANDLGYSTGCAWADYDNDGFLDLFVANGWLTQSQNNFLYHNNGNSNGWLTLKLVGTVSNRSAIGAKVRVKATIHGRTFWQLREISGGSNYGSQNDMRASIGLGDATNIDLVRIEWPSGTVQELHDVAARQFITIAEPPRLLASKTNGTPQFTLHGGRGFNYQIETSTNLPDWSPLGTVTITNQNGTVPIEQSMPLDGSQKFYRALLR